jgi:hypothetical protein
VLQRFARIHEVLEHDKQEPVKQRHTAKRILDRLEVERGYTGGYTMVKEAIREWKDATKEFIRVLLLEKASREELSAAGDWPVLNPPFLEQPVTPEQIPPNPSAALFGRPAPPFSTAVNRPRTGGAA